MNEDAYNYRIFELHTREFEEFSTHAPMATMRAPSFPLEHLDTGETVAMKELWKSGLTVIEFGSFS